MTRDQELIDRLAEADPAPSEPLREAQRREADALLERIVAQPREERPKRRFRLPRVAVAGAVGACVAAAVVTVVDLIDSGPSGDGIAARAAAAVGDPDAVYHVVERLRMSGPGIHEGYWVESWFGPGRRSRSLQYRLDHGRRGKLASEAASDGERIFLYDPESGSVSGKPYPIQTSGDKTKGGGPPKGHGPPGVEPFGDPAAQLRKFESAGRLHAAGRTRVRGRPAYRLVSDTTSDHTAGVIAQRESYLVDARTYFPLEERAYTRSTRPPGTITGRREFLRYEKLPATPENLHKLRHGHYRK